MSEESIDRGDQLGYKALWAMLADEARLRNVFLRRLKDLPKATDQQPTPEVFDRIYQAYIDVLRHQNEAPADIAENIGSNELLKRVADLEAHRHLYLGRSVADTDTFIAGFKHLWQAYLGTKASGKAAEIALIGLLRYGPKAYAGAKKEQLAPIDDLTPIVEFTLPREDALGAASVRPYIAETNKRDLLFFLPEPVKAIIGFDLGTGGQGPIGSEEANEGRRSYGKLKTSPSGLNMSAPQLCKLWEAIGSSEKQDMPSGDERVMWRATYEEIMNDILRRIPEAYRETAHTLFLPRATRFLERQPKTKNYNPEKLKYDSFFTLAAIRIAWPQVIRKAPWLMNEVGETIHPSNWETAKQALINLHRTDPTHPALEPFFSAKRPSRTATSSRKAG